MEVQQANIGEEYTSKDNGVTTAVARADFEPDEPEEECLGIRLVWIVVHAEDSGGAAAWGRRSNGNQGMS